MTDPRRSYEFVCDTCPVPPSGEDAGGPQADSKLLCECGAKATRAFEIPYRKKAANG